MRIKYSITVARYFNKKTLTTAIRLTASGVFRRRATVRCPPFGPTMKIFYRRLYMKRCVFCHSSARIAKFNNVQWSFFNRYNMRLKSPCEIASDMTLWFSSFPNFRKKWANLRLLLNVRKQKVFQLQGGFAPWLPDQGLCPWTPLGALPRPPL